MNMQNVKNAVTAMAIVMVPALASSASTEAGSPLQLDSRHVILVDDHYIDQTSGIARRYHQAVKHQGNPLLKPDRPWETYNVYLGGTVLHDGGKFRLYYTTYNPYEQPAKTNFICYAQSEDGLIWTKPVLGVVDYKGSKQNNILLRALPPELAAMTVSDYGWAECQGITVIRDTPERDTDPGRRYKGVVCQVTNFSGNHRYSQFPCFSPDGLKWTRLNEPVFIGRTAETMHLLDDPTYPGYVLYHKMDTDRGSNPGTDPPHRRSRALTTSKDFMHWSKAKLFMKADDKDQPNTHMYSMSGFAYGNMYLGFLTVYHPKTITYIDQTRQFRVKEVQLIYSHDALKWHRIEDRTQFIIPVGGKDDWDLGKIQVGSNAPIRMGDELWIYYGGAKVPKHVGFTRYGPYPRKPTGFIGLAKLRLDGFASLGPEERQQGTIVTKPLTLAGETLYVNADVKGSLKVELLMPKGEWSLFIRK